MGQIDVLILFGIGIFGGALGAYLFQKIRVPQVVGYIIIGVVIGKSGLQVVSHDTITKLQSFNWFALGIIGFLVGGELQWNTFRKYGKQFMAVMLGEGVSAFVLVSVLSAGIAYFVTHSVTASLGAGVVLGAIAAATDPASTMDVLWEYRSRGFLTTAIIAVVALDDALAMTLYGLCSSIAQMLTGEHSVIMHEMTKIARELFGSVFMGGACALLLNYLIKKLSCYKERMLVIATGMLLLVIGVADAARLDVILVTMSMGIVLVNIAPKRSHELFILMRSFSAPVYVMFFVLVGASLGIAEMPLWLWAIVVVYVLARSLGKMFGAYAGARFSGADISVQRYAGIGLFAQGGVSIGLSIMASQHLTGVMLTDTLSLGDMIVYCVTATTMIIQLAGPSMVKLSVSLAGEIGRNVTEEDVIATMTVADVMETPVVPIKTSATINEAVKIFSEQDYLVHPVVNETGKAVGTLSLENLKEIVADQDFWKWMLVDDVLPQSKDFILAGTPLCEALEVMADKEMDEVPVVENIQSGIPVGILDMRSMKKRIKQEVVERQKVVCVADAKIGKVA
ncbi:MAG: cation:proton antiporter [Candidatus Auribacterota bacterium]|jgi:Kef-type K+ transport system membrane component KefB|nr:cation:proton antiporter [Candidatus Auribacterota bacterium]